MEGNEISLHQVKIYRFLKQAQGWVTAHDIAKGAQVAERTARSHALRLVKLMILDQAEVFPGHRYRLSPMAMKRNQGYIKRLEQAQDIFGLSKESA
jgi:hypothetical protein